MMLTSRRLLSVPVVAPIVAMSIVALPLMYSAAATFAKEKKIVADIRGKITNVSPNQTGRGPETLGRIRVEGKVEKDTGFDKASIRITNETVIERKGKDGKRTAEKFSAFKEGQLVESTFTGPIAESYPVQTAAKSILILED
jgi:beta-N-acetylhexosaminidase